MDELIIEAIARGGYFGIFLLMVLENVVPPVPSEVIMGIGGVLAMGCSVGQGVTGFAALAWSGPVTLAAIAAGATLGLRQLIGGFDSV